MSTYLKNMAGYKHNQLKSKSYDEIQEMFDKEMKRVNTFVDMNTELVKGSKTKAEEEAEMKRHIETVKDDKVAINAIPLATKPPVIVEYQIDKDGRMRYFKLIRADGSSKRRDAMKGVLWEICKNKSNIFMLVEKDIPFTSIQNLKLVEKKLLAIVGIRCIQKMNIKFRGGLLGLKDFKMILRVTASQVQSTVELQKKRVIEVDALDKLLDKNHGSLNLSLAKATLDESNLWHKRLRHINFKTMNKLVRGNLVRGLPSKIFENNHTCVACQKGKKHKASSKTKTDSIVEKNLHVSLREDTPNIAGSKPNWLFDIDALIKSMNYEPVVVGNQSNGSACIKACDDAGKPRMETVPSKDYILLPFLTQDLSFSSSSKDSPDAGFKPSEEEEKKDAKDPENEDSEKINACNENIVYGCDDDLNMPNLEDIVYSDDDEGVDAKADMTNLDTHILNKKDERGIVIRNKARLVAQGYTQEEMDVKSAFLYGKIEEEVYVCQPQGFEDPEFPDKVYKVEKALYGLHQAPRACQDKYVDEFLKKFGFSTVKTASTHMETSKPLLKYAEAEDVDFHLYRSMIGSLMYLTTSRPDVMFVVCACTRFQVTPKVSHLHAVKRIFRYLKGQPKLGLWYPKDSPFDLEAYTDSDYAGASLDRKSTTGGCQFLGRRLISWQCKKQTVVANSTTEAEYVAASSCCGQVLWIQNQLLDYGYNFMNTKIFIDNESTICIVKNPVFHSKTKHIEIRHHFIRDSYEKRLIQVIKIHTDHNVADLLTKAFDVSRFQFLTASIGMLNL
ncbi:putative ribonuclease H-like domain-containing protein [Tanacetum coccineum]|uniref:Ribonuclease H-like domain-containing protein n=1 Tax=Tanacetum coccineum TaxID=301880 RepID=A0ABQ5DM30_9ASTR